MPDVRAVRAGRWVAASAAAAVLMATGCSVATSPSLTSEPPWSPVATGPAPIRSIPPSPCTVNGHPSVASVTPIPGLAVSGPVPLSRVLVICERWGENPPDTVIGCRDGASMAFAALGPDRSASIRRLDVTYGSSCPASGACAARRPMSST
jgi:hypothetical protein